MKHKTTLMILGSLVALPLFGVRSSDSYTIGAEGLLPQTSYSGGSYVLEGTMAGLIGGSSDSYTVTSGANPPSLPLSPPVITEEPEMQDLLEGDTLILDVAVVGPGPFVYTWLKDGEPIEGADGSTLEIMDVTNDDEGEYSVTISNPIGEVNSLTASVTVLALPVIVTDLEESVDAIADDTLDLMVEAEVEGTPEYQWFKDGSPIEGATTESLELANVVNEDEGTYSVEITNEAGSVTSGELALNVIFPPVITADLDPLEDPLLEGDDITFSIEADVEGTPVYQWFQDGTAIDGATGTSLELTGVTGAEEGDYTVEVSNEAGSVTSMAVTLAVIEVPVILTQPSGVTVKVGGFVNLNVSARTEGTTTYAWFKDGTPVDGATRNVLTIVSADAEDEGEYTVEVSNEAGSVTSDPAVVSLRRGEPGMVPGALVGSLFLSEADGRTTYESDWFGEFYIEEDFNFGWVWTDPLGLTFITSISTPDEAYIYPLLVGGILFTADGLYPNYAYSYDDASWYYLDDENDANTGSIWVYRYSDGMWVEFSE